ncbi:MAG: DUF1574 domain-containing protein [Candidatus Obscuribacterales bacterium]|nr:DUF1574 domain-containing protein [Candidatus Obscuribacterales bacterium]
MSSVQDIARKHPLKRFIQSPALLIACALIIGAISILQIAPKDLDASDGIPNQYKVLVSKLSSFLRSTENPDVVILGSSLVLMPAVRCDDRLKGKLDCFDDWYYYKHIPEYTQANYLEHLLSKSGLTVQIKNLGIASSIMSDHASVFETILSNGKHPGLVICGIAPRDFLDNSQQHFQDTPTQLFLKEYRSSCRLFPSSLARIDVQDWYDCAEHQFKKFLAGIRTRCTTVACELTHHPPHLQHPKTKETYMESRPNMLKDLETYKRLYNPPNYQMLDQQRSYLDKFLSMAKANTVEVLLVNMPLTLANTKSLDSAAYSKYLQTIAEVAKKHDVALLDIGSASPKYSVADFEDCCHLNTAGGLKLYDSILDRLLTDQRLAASMARTNEHVANNARRRALAARESQSPQ